jgi:hypothetical protein
MEETLMLPGREGIDRSKLNFFLAGPGPGEGLALALPLPAGGWIFVDGCKSGAEEFPLQRIWERYRVDGEPVLGIVLSHPHQDHYEGMLELISATSPRWLACVATHHADEGVLGAPDLALRDAPLLAAHPELELAMRRVKDLLSRIQHEWNLGHCGRVVLRAGRTLPLEREGLAIEVVAPDGDGASAFFRAPDLPERIRTRANELSAVLHVRYGNTRLVLGADLPEHDHGVGPRTGWTTVLASYADMPGSLVLKVPHHGSDGAMHDAMVGPDVAPEGAVWALTPFRGGDRRDPLPKLHDGKGVAALLRGVPHVYLTSLPSGWTSTAPLDGPVPITTIQRAPAAASLPIGRASPRLNAPPGGPLDAVWAFTVDDAGHCVGAFRGERALQICATPAAGSRP